MVYYPSLPLIMKTESTNQAHLCSSLLSSSNSGGLPSEIGDSRQQIQVSSNSTTTAAADGADRGSIPFSFQHQYQNTTTANMVIREQPITSITSRLSGAKTMIITNGTIIPEANFLSSSNSSGGGGGSSIKTEPRQPSESATVAYCRAKAGRKMSSTLAAGAIATTATKKPQFKCEQCGMTFGSKSAHTSHTKSHMKLDMMDGGGGGGAGAGGVNNEVIPSNSSMPIGIPKSPIIKSNGGHNAAGGGGDPYECNVCQKTFAVPARLIRHYRTHTGERPFECEFCHKLFSVKENLQVHRRIHTKERPYKCDVCGRAFEHSGKLHRHMRIHTGERPHKCSVCGKTFIQSGQLVIHMRTHTGEKPYKCPVEACGKGFTCSKQLKVHSRTHTGEKPYHCDICFRDFGYNHVLKLHRVQHYGSKCYKCTICEETFKSKKEMEAHIKGHANELPDDDEDDGCTSGGGGSATGGEDDTVTVAVPATAAAVVSSSSSSLSSNEVIAAAADLSLAPPSISSPHASMMLTQVVPQQQQQQQQQLSHKPAKRFNSNKRQQSNNNNNNNKNYSSGSNNALSISSSSSPVARYSPNCCSLSPSPSSLSSSSSSSSSFSSSLNFNNLETDQSRDSGVLSISLRRHNETNSSIDEVPTDLRVMDVVPAAALLHQSTTNATTTTITTPSSSTSTNTLQSTFDYQQEEKHDRQPCYHSSNIYHRYQARRSLSPPELNYHPKPFSPYIMSVDEEEQQHQPTTTTTATRINPVLLEAASIASRCSVQTEEDNKAAISIMQLRNNLLGSQQQQQQQQNQRHYISTREMEQKSSGRHSTIEQTKNDEFTAQSNVQKRYVGVTPVPQYEPMLLNNEIVRQVEAAIAPLRSKSTESPERVSSPESDSIMMLADRDVMTLPLRKRKIYMNENQPKPSTTTTTTVAAAVGGGGEAGLRVVGGNEVVPKVIRMNSVIKFAKAS